MLPVLHFKPCCLASASSQAIWWPGQAAIATPSKACLAKDAMRLVPAVDLLERAREPGEVDDAALLASEGMGNDLLGQLCRALGLHAAQDWVGFHL